MTDLTESQLAQAWAPPAADPQPYVPSCQVVLVDPKYAHNVGAAVRAAATLGAYRVTWTGGRIDLTGSRGKPRLPREERLRAYARRVEWGWAPDLGDLFDGLAEAGVTPVALEYNLDGAQWLPTYQHPDGPVCYVFGPEDGSLGNHPLSRCHQFVRIPTRGCVNLSAAVYLTLYDRQVKSGHWLNFTTSWRDRT